MSQQWNWQKTSGENKKQLSPSIFPPRGKTVGQLAYIFPGIFFILLSPLKFCLPLEKKQAGQASKKNEQKPSKREDIGYQFGKVIM